MQDQSGSAGGADIKPVSARADCMGKKGKLLRAQAGRADFGASNGGSGADGGEMLRLEAGFGPAGTDVEKMEGLACDERQG